MSTNIDGIFHAFNSVRLHKIRGGVLPSDITDKLDQLCHFFANASNEVRRAVTDRVSVQLSFLFFIHAENMAFRAVREKSEDRLLIGLKALAIEDCTFDWRDSTVRMALLYHSAKLIGVDPDDAFRRISRIAMPKANRYFLAFVEREPKYKSLAEFGFKESTTASGEFTYESIPFRH